MEVVERPVKSADEITVILGALSALRRGDASVRLPAEWHGVLGRVADVFNDVVERNQRMAQELERLSTLVGKQGKLSKRGNLGDVSGFWATSIDAVNQLIDDGRLPRGTGKDQYRRLNIHRIDLGGLGTRLAASSKMKTDYDFFELLHRAGMRAAKKFLDTHFDDIGRRSTIDLAAESGVEWA